MKTSLTHLVLLIISILFLVTACQKQSGPTTVSGHVTETYKGQAIGGATVYILEAEEGGWGNIGSGYSFGSPIKETTTASDGSYEIGFDARKGYVYYVTAAKVECQRVDWNTSNEGSYVSIDKGKKNTGKIIPLIAYGYVRLHIKNINPSDSNDAFTIYTSYHSIDSSVNNTHELDFFGMGIDTIIKIALAGNFNNSKYYYVMKNGIWSDHIANIYCSAFDTTTFNINY